MALVEITGGSQTATVNTEHTLTTDTTGGTRILAVNLSNMVIGDMVELKLYTKLRAGSAEFVAYSVVFQHNQAEPNVYSVPVPANISIKPTLKQTAGTGKAFEWALLGI